MKKAAIYFLSAIFLQIYCTFPTGSEWNITGDQAIGNWISQGCFKQIRISSGDTSAYCITCSLSISSSGYTKKVKFYDSLNELSLTHFEKGIWGIDESTINNCITFIIDTAFKINQLNDTTYKFIYHYIPKGDRLYYASPAKRDSIYLILSEGWPTYDDNKYYLQ